MSEQIILSCFLLYLLPYLFCKTITRILCAKLANISLFILCTNQSQLFIHQGPLIKQLSENNMLASIYFFKNNYCLALVLAHDNRHVCLSTLNWSSFVDVLLFSLILIWYYLHVNDMPPKKKLRLIDSQQKLTLSLFSSGPRQSPETPGVETDKQVEIDIVEGAKPSSSSKPVKTRSFLHTWTKMYSWLRYDQNNDFMFCEVCTVKNKKNSLTKDAKCRNFQNSTLTRHVALQEHQMALQKAQPPEHFRAALEKAAS